MAEAFGAGPGLAAMARRGGVVSTSEMTKVAEFGLGGDVAVEYGVADTEGAGDVDNGGLGRAEATDDVFGGGEDAVAGEGVGGGDIGAFR